jgi:hypothetical protein
MRGPTIVGLAGLVACKLGGPTGDPNEYVTFRDAANDRASSALSDATSVPSGDDGNTAASDGTNTGNAPVTDSSGDDGNDASGIGDARTDDAPDDITTEGGVCSGAVAVCDPVRNTGCNALQQCDVDPSQTTTPTGLCVFATLAEGSPCLSTIFTESCPPSFTCVNSDCRQLCFCNADCPTGQCCSDTSGPPGFTLCRPCP